jgi:hypothetical protein
MVATMRVDNQNLRKERDQYKEINRLLLKENLDLKDYLESIGYDIKENILNLKDLYSVFGNREQDEMIDVFEEAGDDDESIFTAS